MGISKLLRRGREALSLDHDPYWDQVICLIPGTDFIPTNNNFNDAKGKIFSFNNTTSSSVDPKFGSNSILFNHYANSLVSVYESDYGLAYTDFTVECFIKPSNIVDRMTIATNRNGGVNGWLFAINAGLNGRIGFSFIGISGLNSDSVIVADQWQHIAATNHNDYLRLFVNGVMVAGMPTNYSANPAMPLQIGRTMYDSGNYYPYSGYMQQFRITRGIARYISNFIVPNKPFPLS
jgi:hypothetical protein